ncbi:hypothetical protein TCAL_05677 [Tigriopus californicus]|uniref:C-type lectin domain-containing protein n=1 Tax=Tigriopus californicus TaxID=6832 RepID=A0A553PHF8_TIGCA|nr:C-type lectin domain family 4 member F-like [Tigriopus californicus]TRY77121.1 hypothetical protein TCAL_05677 [Tigriopus californicus]
MAYCKMDMLDLRNSKTSSSHNYFKFGILISLMTIITSVIVYAFAFILYGGYFHAECGCSYNRTEIISLQAQIENQSQNIQDMLPNFRNDLAEIQEQMSQQIMNVRQEIQSQANSVEQKANEFASVADKNITQTLELMSQEHGESVQVLEEMNKKIADIQEAKIFKEEIVDDLRSQMFNVSANTEMLEVIHIKLNSTEQLIKDLTLWKEYGFEDVLQYHLEESSILLDQKLTHRFVQMIKAEIQLSQDAMKEVMDGMLAYYDQFEARLNKSSIHLNLIKANVSQSLDKMKTSLLETIKTDPSFQEVLLPKSPVYEFPHSDKRMTYNEALQYCAQKGGHLPMFQSSNPEPEYATLLAKATERNIELFWLGATDIGNEGLFTWSDGTPMVFTRWNRKEPNNHNGNEHCVEVRTSSRVWNDSSCEKKRRVICQL